VVEEVRFQQSTARGSIAPAVLSLVLVALALLMRLLMAASEIRVPELALASLRGVSSARLWLLGLAEPLAVLAVSIPLGVGFGVGLGAVLIRQWLVPGLPLPLPWLSWAAAALVLVAAIAGGLSWWGDEASLYRRLVYKPIALAASVNDGAAAARQLDLTLTDPGWLPNRKLDDLLPDHGHLMHLFVVRVPGLDALAHLHPTEVAPGHFTQPLPWLPAGEYQLFADIVHANGLGETATTRLTIAAEGAKPTGAPTGDDAVGTGAPIVAGGIAGAAEANPVATLADGTRVIWLRDRDGAAGDAPVPLTAGRATWFRFAVQDRDGTPARDVLPYMGMAGHAVFLSHDRAVFAHVHPTGSVPMAALALVSTTADPHAGHHMAPEPLPPEIAFPYACPRAGDYRIFVQFRRGDVIETAIFDAPVR
jgi:hypothetical protein